jgi:hypothetical protein
MSQVEGDGADKRDTSLVKREADLAAHLETVVEILDAAQRRDVDAEVRDEISVERDRAADLEAFISRDGDNGYGADLPARRHAARDRSDAKGDRTAAADDRVALADVADDLGVPAKNGLEKGAEERSP